ncbi:MAG: diguanylate cyclase [Ectothiorhodospiraceae bacterium]|nr:diguanylate cyclase [Ectothiorhodospiraceae bacterium]
MSPTIRSRLSLRMAGVAVPLVSAPFSSLLASEAAAAESSDWLLPVLVIVAALVALRVARKGGPTLLARLRLQLPSRRSPSDSRGIQECIGLLCETSSIAVMVHDADSLSVLYANQRALESYGVESVEDFNRYAFDEPRIWDGAPYDIGDLRERFRQTRESGTVQRFDWPSRRLDGKRIWEDVSLQPMLIDGEQRIVSVSIDITPQKLAQEREEHRNRVLTALAAGHSMDSILHMLVESVEKEDPAALCSILLLDSAGKHLRHGAAGRLPEAYLEAVDGLRIGDNVGSCGTAAYTGRRVITPDIETDPSWEPGRATARQFGLRSCWSEPVLSASGQVLGTFAIYHEHVASPSEEDIERLRIAVDLASLTIERRTADQELSRRSALEDVLRNVSAQLLDMSALQADTEIVLALGRLGNHVGADRCYLMQLSSDDLHVSVGYEWCAKDVPAMRENRQTLPTDRFAAWLERLRGHECIAVTVSESERDLREYPERADIQSLLIVPMFQQGTLRGALCFDAVREPHYWPASDTNLLKVAANLLGSALMRARLERELERQAGHDSLTGLLNRRRFEEIMAKELRRASRYRGTFTVILFDVDHFKAINDGFGHDVGDRVLQQLAATVREHTRDSDSFGRWGGEEFMLLLPETGPEDAWKVAESIRRSVEQARFDGPGRVTLSVGVSSHTRGDTLSTLLKRADHALYRAKEMGRNRTVAASFEELSRPDGKQA